MNFGIIIDIIAERKFKLTREGIRHLEDDKDDENVLFIEQNILL